MAIPDATRERFEGVVERIKDDVVEVSFPTIDPGRLFPLPKIALEAAGVQVLPRSLFSAEATKQPDADPTFSDFNQVGILAPTDTSPYWIDNN